MDIRVGVYKSIAHIFNALCIYIYVPYSYVHVCV